MPRKSRSISWAGKPVGICKHIGRRPIVAFGNSDGDWEMLQYTMAVTGARVSLLVHHDDEGREYAYERLSKIGRLDGARDDVAEKGLEPGEERLEPGLPSEEEPKIDLAQRRASKACTKSDPEADRAARETHRRAD